MQRILASQDFARAKETRQSNANPLSERKKRLILLSCVLFAWIFVVISRLVHLQITSNEAWGKWALRQHITKVTVSSERGPIYDSLGKLMAVSVPASSVFVRPRSIEKARRPEVAASLARALDLKPEEMSELLERKQPFVWVKRQMPRADAERIVTLNLPGVGSVMEAKRYYPYNSSASTLIGRVGVDGEGLSGIERAFENTLSAPPSSESMVKDALGNLIETAEASEALSPAGLPRGQPLHLTLDAELQSIVDEEVIRGHKDANSKAVLAVMVDASSGDILALSQSPSPNFNTSQIASPDQLHNLVAEMVLEPGSIMKPLVTSAALNEGITKPDEMFDCENGRYSVGKHVIKDVHPSGVISVRDIVVRSSNIGMTKLGMRLGKERLYQYLTSFGFGAPSGLNLPGETRGILRHPSSWALVDVATHSFGQGVAVTPLQMVRAVSTVVNGGLRPELRVVQGQEPKKFVRILSSEVAREVKEMMFGVVEDEHGTGGNAKLEALEGYRIGGKTGTAQKARKDGRGYQSGVYASSFIGFVEPPANKSKSRNYVLLVTVDEPHAKSIYGGVLAAPVFQRIMTRAIALDERRGA